MLFKKRPDTVLEIGAGSVSCVEHGDKPHALSLGLLGGPRREITTLTGPRLFGRQKPKSSGDLDAATKTSGMAPVTRLATAPG